VIGHHRAVGVVTCLLAVVVGGCGGDDPREVLRETAANLADIRSGDLSVRMTVEGQGAAARGGAVGFALRGPFALPAGGGLPKARVAYTQLAGDRRATVTLTTTGEAAFVTVGGRSYRLPDEQTRRLRTGAGGLAEDGAGDRLRIGDWVRDPKLSDGGRVGGTETDRITARLDVPAAARDLLRLSQALGPAGAARPLEGAAARDLEQAVRRATFVLHTGADDRIMRRLAIAVDLAVRGAPGARIRFALAVSRPGRRVEVEAPPDALPASALPRG
jgi:hypothetical protein